MTGGRQEPREDHDREDHDREDHSPDYTVAFSPRQIGGFVLVAALILAVVRWLRRPRGKV